jgi:23S rRNA (cytosine1962-C5)-methyltransferase
MRENAGSAGPMDYALLAVGDGRRLERFGSMVLDRPAPTARMAGDGPPSSWSAADLRFDGTAWWRGTRRISPHLVDPWPARIGGLTLELRPTASGGVGVYPEHAAHLPWLQARIGGRRGSDRPPEVLNLFAHTGLATLAAARAGAAVTHVDAARGAVTWARKNAQLSGLAESRTRWIVDDAEAFVLREGRRGRRYDGFVIDPPSFGRAGGRSWRLADGLPGLLERCADVARDDAFVLLTAHTTGIDGATLRDRVRDVFRAQPRHVEASAAGLESVHGAWLELGWAVRVTR